MFYNQYHSRGKADVNFFSDTISSATVAQRSVIPHACTDCGVHAEFCVKTRNHVFWGIRIQEN